MTAGTFHEDQPKRALQDIIADGEASAYEAALIAKMSRDLPDIKRIGVMSSKEELKWGSKLPWGPCTRRNASSRPSMCPTLRCTAPCAMQQHW
jgi:hypothetical protein